MLEKLKQSLLSIVFYSSSLLGNDCSSISSNYSKIIERYIADNSNICIVYIADTHKPNVRTDEFTEEINRLKPGAMQHNEAVVKDVQKELFRTLEELISKNNLKVLGIEGLDVDVAYEPLSQLEKLMVFKGGIVKQEELDKFIDEIIQENYSTGVYVEMMYPGLVTFGAEDIGIFNKQVALLLKVQESSTEFRSDLETGKYKTKYKSKAEILNRRDEINNMINELHAMNNLRSQAAVNNVLKKMESHNITTGALVMGGLHTKPILDYLKELNAKGKKISYVVLEPRSSENYINVDS